MHLAALGIAAAIVDLVGVTPYFIDIFRGKTKPERVSFWIFLLLNAITFAAQAAGGWSWAALLVGLSVITTGGIAILSLKYGYGKFKKKDVVSVGVALLGVAIWLTTNHPLVAVLMVILVDLSGFWLTIVKSWEAPHTETLIAWVAGAVSTSLAALAVGRFDPVQISYVLYSAIANWLLVIIIVYRRRTLASQV